MPTDPLPRQKATDVTNELSVGARLLLERVSIVIEGTPGLSAQAIRVRARVSRRDGDAAIEWLRRHEYIERHRQDQEWRYASVSPYRAGDART